DGAADAEDLVVGMGGDHQDSPGHEAAPTAAGAGDVNSWPVQFCSASARPFRRVPAALETSSRTIAPLPQATSWPQAPASGLCTGPSTSPGAPSTPTSGSSAASQIHQAAPSSVLNAPG